MKYLKQLAVDVQGFFINFNLENIILDFHFDILKTIFIELKFFRMGIYD